MTDAKTAKLRIWQLTIGEPIPQDGDDVRLHRAGQMCAWLAERGHHATFINSSFYHQKREQRYEETTSLNINENFDVVCLKARPYGRSISFSRFASHRDAADSFRRWLNTDPAQPDIIIASYPVVELCAAAVEYARPRGIPVIMDCRDFWPDIFVEILPRPLRWIGKSIFAPFESQARKTLSLANSITGHTKSARDWGLAKAGRVPTDTDFHFPFSYPTIQPEHRSQMSDKDVEDNLLNICFLGTLSHRSNLEMFIEALGSLPYSLGEKIQLHIAGTGPHLTMLTKLAQQHGAPVTFHGWLDQADMIALMNRCDFGLLPYNRSDFHISLPNKFIEYLAGGLPVLSCTEGEVETFMKENSCGIWVAPQKDKIARSLKGLIDNKPHYNADMIYNVFSKHFTPDAVFSFVEGHLLKLSGKSK